VNVLVNIPNLLTLIRICLVPVMVAVSSQGHANLFLGILIFAFFTDALDGFIARTFGLQTKFGARLDSLADFAVYISIPICAWLLWPDVIRKEMIYVLAVVASIVMPVGIGILKFGSYTSYHTWLTKLAAASMAIASILLFVGGPVWLFRSAAMLCVLAALEEILITLILKEPKSNVRSLWTVLRNHRKHA